MASSETYSCPVGLKPDPRGLVFMTIDSRYAENTGTIFGESNTPAHLQVDWVYLILVQQA